MAKKNVAKASDDTRNKAKQLREAQEASDRRTRNIIIASVSILVVLIVAAIVLVVVNRPTPEKAASSLPEQFQGGEPIIVSSEGVGVRNPDAEDLTLYFDYTCGACAQLEVALSPNLIDDAKAGKYNLLLQPVVTSGHPYLYAATAGALVVAAEDPDNFTVFHDELVQFYYDSAVAGDNSVYDDLAASSEKVAEIAAGIGVPAELISTFSTDASTAYLQLATNTWVAADIEGRTQTATPQIVVNGAEVSPTGSTGAEVMEELLAAVAAVKD